MKQEPKQVTPKDKTEAIVKKWGRCPKKGSHNVGTELQHKLFIDYYITCFNATEAALRVKSVRRIRKNKPKNRIQERASAASFGCLMMKKPEIVAAIKRKLNVIAKNCEVKVAEVILRLRRNEADAYEAGKLTESTRCLELLGKTIGMFTDKIDVSSEIILGPREIILNVIDEKTGTEVKQVINQRLVGTVKCLTQNGK